MSADVCLVSDPKGGNACGTAEEGDIVIKEEMDDEASFVDLLMKPNDHQDDGGPYLAGNLVQVTIKEEDEQLTSTETALPLESKPLPKPANLKPGPTYACTICGASFPDKATTLLHISNHARSTREKKIEPTASIKKSLKPPKEKKQVKCPKPDGGFLCDICKKSFTLEDDLREHQEQKHTVLAGCHKMYPCDLCGRTLAGLTNLNNHRRLHTGERPYACRFCPARFHSQNALGIHERETKEHQAHLKRKMGSETTTRKEPPSANACCTLCPRIFPRVTDLPGHLALHEQSASPPTCSVCGAVYRGEKQLAVHLTRVHPEAARPRKKKQRKERSATEGDEISRQSKKQKVSHSDAPEKTEETVPFGGPTSPYPCPLCPRTYTYRTSLNFHTRRAHPPPGVAPVTRTVTWARSKRHVCDLCGKAFDRRSHLVVHQRVHAERPFPCTECSYRGTTEKHLSKHQKVHLKEHQTAVNEPEAAVDEPETAVDEPEVAVNEPETAVNEPEVAVNEPEAAVPEPKVKVKSFPCTACPRSFTHSSKLAKHLTVDHTVPSPCVCPHCGALYPTSAPLQRHQIADHPSEAEFSRDSSTKKWICPQCPRGFDKKDKLVEHLEHHKVETPPRCDLCGGVYKHERSLSKHRGSAHLKGASEAALTEPKGKSNQCTACPRSFSHSAQLAKHLTVDHTVPSPSVCPTCGALYPTVASLNQHQTRVHPSEAEFRRASSKRNLLCPLCPRMFEKKRKLGEHLEHHQVDSSPRCTLCGAVYKHKISLSKHQRSVHPGMEKHKREKKMARDKVMEESRECEDDDENDDDDDEEEIVFTKTVPYSSEV